jgi:hypothetical protein
VCVRVRDVFVQYDPLGAVQKHIVKMTEQATLQASQQTQDKRKKRIVQASLRSSLFNSLTLEFLCVVRRSDLVLPLAPRIRRR